MEKHAHCQQLVQINPQKHLNPWKYYNVADDFLIIENLIQNHIHEFNCYQKDIGGHEVLKLFKSVECSFSSLQNNLISFYLNNIQNEHRISWQYVVERFESFGNNEFKQLADLIEKICYEQNFREQKLNYEQKLIQQEIEQIYTSNFQDKIVFTYQFIKGKFNSQLASIHYNSNMIQLLNHNKIDFISEHQKKGLMEIYTTKYYAENSMNMFKNISQSINSIQKQVPAQTTKHIEQFITKYGNVIDAELEVSKILKEDRFYINFEVAKIINIKLNECRNYEVKPIIEKITDDEKLFAQNQVFKKNQYITNEFQEIKICGYRHI